jgi:hypothetical protein
VSSKVNWPAVSAMAAASSVMIACIAYVVPHSMPSPAPAPQPVMTMPVTTTTPQGEGLTTTTPTAAPVAPTTTPAQLPLSIASLPAPGCDEALSVLDTYYRTAGTTESSQDAAAQQAYQGMMGAGLDSTGAVHTVVVKLANDFMNMSLTLEGQEDGNYGAEQATTNSDAQTLRSLCAG